MSPEEILFLIGGDSKQSADGTLELLCGEGQRVGGPIFAVQNLGNCTSLKPLGILGPQTRRSRKQLADGLNNLLYNYL